MLLICLGLFTLSSAGTISDELWDRRFGSAAAALAGHVIGFVLALGMVRPGLANELLPVAPLLLALAVAADLGCSAVSARALRVNAGGGVTTHEELFGLGLLVSLRVPGYVLAVLLVLSGGIEA